MVCEVFIKGGCNNNLQKGASHILFDISETQNLTFLIFQNLKPKFLVSFVFGFQILGFVFCFLPPKQSRPFLRFKIWIKKLKT